MTVDQIKRQAAASGLNIDRVYVCTDGTGDVYLHAFGESRRVDIMLDGEGDGAVLVLVDRLTDNKIMTEFDDSTMAEAIFRAVEFMATT